MTKHTPEPWSFEYDDLTEQWVVSWEDGFAEVGGLYADDKARLIAAAPELLAALESMVLYYGWQQSEGDASERLYELVGKALAKAKGETG